MQVKVAEDKLVKLEKTVEEMNKNLGRLINLLDGDTNLKNGLATMVSSHESRIKNLEDWQIKVIAIYTVITVIFSVLSPIIYGFIKGS